MQAKTVDSSFLCFTLFSKENSIVSRDCEVLQGNFPLEGKMPPPPPPPGLKMYGEAQSRLRISTISVPQNRDFVTRL